MFKFFINRPIVAMVISILMVIVGAVTITALPVAQFPNIVPPEVQVLATYVGADAKTIEQSVSTPIEQQMSGVDNMNYMYSLNSTADGLMRLIVDYDVKTDPNTDLMLTQLRQTQAASQMPSDVTNYGVTVQKTATAPFTERHLRLAISCQLRVHQICLTKSTAPTALAAFKFSVRGNMPCVCG